MGKRRIVALLLVAALLAGVIAATVVGCGTKTVQRTDLILATTTSTQDTGLLDQWIPMFEADNPYNVKVIAVGSGQSIEMGRKGECDVMLVHSPAAEEQLVADGFAIDRKTVMHNDFVIIGPLNDPAGAKSTTTSAAAFTAIANTQVPFFSRGDGSGTNTKEIAIWKTAGITPTGQTWYTSTGSGMADTLRITNEKQGYTIADRGTWLAQKANLPALQIVEEGDPGLFNQYHVMAVNPEKYPNVNNAGAEAFVNFCVSKKAQEFLNTFGVDKYGQQLFFPDALSS